MLRKGCMYTQPAIHKQLSLLICPNDVHYDVTLIPEFCQTKRHFECIHRQVVDTSIIGLCVF